MKSESVRTKAGLKHKTMLLNQEKWGNLNFLLWSDKRFHYLQISIQIVTIVSLVSN